MVRIWLNGHLRILMWRRVRHNLPRALRNHHCRLHTARQLRRHFREYLDQPARPLFARHRQRLRQAGSPLSLAQRFQDRRASHHRPRLERMGIMGPLRAPRHVAGRGARLSGTGRKAPGFRGPQHRLTGCRFGTRARIAANRDRGRLFPRSRLQEWESAV